MRDFFIPLLVGIAYYALVVPAGLILKILGRDPLALKADRNAASYWIRRTPPGPAERSMTRQF